MLKSFSFIIFTSLLASCSSVFQQNTAPTEVKLKGYNRLTSIDYIDHLKSFEKDYLRSRREQINIPNIKTRKYLTSLVKNIESSNELFFTEGGEVKFYIIQDEIPFHFSLPGKVFFFSSGLIKKYIKNEVMLYCLLAFDLIRSEKNIYARNIIIPIGSLTSRRILSLLRLNLEDKVEIHKWSYYVLKRIGIQPDSYLSWLQVINRNSIDFATQLGDIHSISQEEAKFKAFLIENEEDKSFHRHSGSSSEFYNFLKTIKG